MADEPNFERVMWAVLWDSQPDNRPRRRHLCMATNRHNLYADHPALYRTKAEAIEHIRRNFEWCLDPRHRQPPQNNRMPKPVRVRVQITMEARDGR